MVEKAIPLEYTPWYNRETGRGQALVHGSDARFRVVMSGRQCLDGDTVVLRRDGTPARLRNHEDAWSTGIRPTRRYRMRGGTEIVCTDNHPVLTPSGFKVAGELRAGDDVVVLSEWDTGGIAPSEGEPELLGYFTTDGTGGFNGQSPKFTNIRPAYLEEFARLVVERFAIEPVRYEKGRGADLLVTTRERRPDRNAFTAWVRSLHWDHRFPLDVFSWDRPSVARFVNRAWSGDGCVRVNGRKPDIFLACGNDEIYARYWQLLLQKLGIWSAIKREHMPKGTGTFHRLVVGCGRDNIARFMTLVGPVFGKEAGHEAILELLRTRRAANWKRNTSWWNRRPHEGGVDGERLALTNIIAIEDAGDREVFDVAYPGKGWFIAQGVVVHNSGKTQLAIAELGHFAMSQPGSISWAVTANYKVKDRIWRGLLNFVPQEIVEKKNETELRIRLGNTSEIFVKSADAPDSLVSESLDFVVCDEAGQWKEEAWTRGIRPMLTVTKGRALFIGTPRGKNWFFDLWMKGRPGPQKDPEYESFHWRTEDSPYSDRKELDEARRNVPRDLFAQEYEADPIDNANGVFRSYKNAVRPGYFTPDRINWLGVDLARKHDFSAFVVMNTKREVIHVERSQADWALQKQRIASLAFRYNASIVIDATSIGDPISSDLRDAGLRVEDVVLSGQMKAQIIDALRLAFEMGSVTIPSDPDLMAELDAYAYEVLPSGGLRYSAPDGQHDDLVIALALANWGARSIPLTASVNKTNRSYMPSTSSVRI